VLESELVDDPTLVAVAVPEEVLLRDVFLPDGTPVLDVKPLITARCRAVPLAGRDPELAWREVPVSVRVAKNGYEYLDFQWTPGRAGRERHVMVPRDPSDWFKR